MINGCREGDSRSQKSLYDKYAGLMLAICKRYIPQHNDAEDVMIEGFYKVFTNIKQFDQRGSFEGWMKRIMVNESLMWLRKRKLAIVEMQENLSLLDENVDTDYFELEEAEVIKILDSLPDGYRTVFNLYVIEEFKHREIAEMLGISINTSKSQLILAKKKIKQIIESKKPIIKTSHE